MLFRNAWRQYHENFVVAHRVGACRVICKPPFPERGTREKDRRSQRPKNYLLSSRSAHNMIVPYLLSSAPELRGSETALSSSELDGLAAGR